MSPGDGRGPFGGGGSVGEPIHGYGRRPRSAVDIVRRLRALAVLLLLAVSVLVIRSAWRSRPAPDPGLVVEVQGAVPSPGLYALAAGSTVRDAFIAAGAVATAVTDPFADLPVHHGYRAVLLPDGSARVWLAEERLLVGIPVDPNTADASLLEQLPGVGPAKARAIVTDRAANGSFSSLDQLERVPGIGPATLESLRPFLGIGGIVEEDLAAPPPGEEASP